MDGARNDAALTLVSGRLDRVEDALVDIAQSLKTLVALEVSHQETRAMVLRAIEAQGRFDGRLREIETEMPGLREMRSWVIGGVLSGIGMIAVALVKLVVVS